ncbi:metal ion transporter metal ion transporter [Colletotrichum higginsianum]|nr:metal ion transporter metal ion transporter [Colletotrichum higginsianum]
MNRPSRTDEPYEGEGYNQSPSPLSNDLTTNEDLNGTVNARELGPARDSKEALAEAGDVAITRFDDSWGKDGVGPAMGDPSAKSAGLGQPEGRMPLRPLSLPFTRSIPPTAETRTQSGKASSFVPGVLLRIDPGNYATGVAAGATYRFRLLFVVLLANLFAIFLQSLCTKLGTVTGLNLAEACRAFLPRWMNYVLYVFAEVAIIATDIAEVIGFAIGLNLLVPAIPLVAGCAISILDVMIILVFYRPHGSMRGLRMFEYFVIGLVLAVVVCFCIQLSLIKDTPVGEVFRGYLPSHAVVESQG